jgi:hypothetical protein
MSQHSDPTRSRTNLPRAASVVPRPLMVKLLATGLVVCLITLSFFLYRHSVAHSTRGLTAEEARRAMVELLRMDPIAFQREFDSAELAEQPLIGHSAGKCTCGDFRISLPDATYKITVVYGCAFQYEGTFQFQGGRWIASRPNWTSAALIK